MDQYAKGTVRIGGRLTLLIGVLGGVAIAVGVPYTVFVYGAALGSTTIGTIAQVCITILALIIGAIIAACGFILPVEISGKTGKKPEEPEEKKVEEEKNVGT